ncbi:MAG: hypothetical protein IPM95_03040 [Sphingobacteriales bacterium]|nr:hypothetical protein [Sphingobacteriales bacterium]
MKKAILSVSILMVIKMNACSQQDLPVAGKVNDQIRITSDSTLSFAFYPPLDTVQPTKVAFIFFDPSGNGALPVHLYKKLADKYNIALIGNNNSSNTNDFNSISAHFAALLGELKTIYHLSEKNIALWGFSGGAKAALKNIGLNNQINYCIYGGSVMDIENNRCELLGFNGKQDMNYTDLLWFANEQQKNLRHYQIQFTGKHTWPDTITAENAFRWLLLKKMQRKELDKDSKLISGTKSAFKKEIKKKLIATHYLDAVNACNKAIFFLQQLTDVSQFETQKAYILNMPQFTAEYKAFETSILKETTLKKEYLQNLFSKDTTYWNKTITELFASSKSDNSGVYNRLLGFLSLAGYTYASRLFQVNDIKALEQILCIYHHSDPSNPEQAYMSAKLWLLKNEPEKAKEMLKESIQLGMDNSRIQSDEIFKLLR